MILFQTLYFPEGLRIGSRFGLSSLQEFEGGPTDGPKKKFGDLYDRLTFDLTNEDYAPFRNLLRDHILKTWPLGPGDDLMGEPVLTRHLHSVLTASREYGIDSRRLRKLLVSAGVVRPVEQGRSDAWELFTPEDAEPVLSRLETLVSATDLQDALLISRTHFESLRKDGYFAPTLEGPEHKPLWDLREARSFIDGLLQGAEPVYVPMHSWAYLSDAAIRLTTRRRNRSSAAQRTNVRIARGAAIRCIVHECLLRTSGIMDHLR